MVLTEEQIQRLKNNREKMLWNIRGIEAYFKEDKKKNEKIMPIIEKIEKITHTLLSFKAIYSNFIEGGKRLQKKIDEFKPILHDENTFKDFLQKVGLQGYRQTQFLPELINEINYFLEVINFFEKNVEDHMTYLHTKISSERVEFMRKGKEKEFYDLERLFTDLSGNLRELLSNREERKNILTSTLELTRGIYALIESVQKQPF